MEIFLKLDSYAENLNKGNSKSKLLSNNVGQKTQKRSAPQYNMIHKQHTISHFLQNLPVAADICWNVPLIFPCPFMEYRSLTPEPSLNSCLNLSIIRKFSATQMLFLFPNTWSSKVDPWGLHGYFPNPTV